MVLVLKHQHEDCQLNGKEINLYTNMTNSKGRRQLVVMGLFCPNCNGIAMTRENYDKVIIERNTAKRKKADSIHSKIAV